MQDALAFIRIVMKNITTNIFPIPLSTVIPEIFNHAKFDSSILPCTPAMFLYDTNIK